MSCARQGDVQNKEHQQNTAHPASGSIMFDCPDARLVAQDAHPTRERFTCTKDQKFAVSASHKESTAA